MDSKGRIILSVILLVTLVGFYLGRYITIETDLTGYSLASAVDLEAYDKAQEAFAYSNPTQTVVIIENTAQWDTYRDFLVLDSLALSWEKIEEVSAVSAITNVVYPRQAVTVVRREKFLNLNSEETFNKRYKDWAAYADITRKFISADRKYALLFISTNSGDQLSQSIIEEIYKAQFPEGIRPLFLQNDLIEQEVKELTRVDSIQLAVISTLLILLTFYLLTKSLKGLFYILLMISFNLACTLLFMLVVDIPFTIHIITVPCIVIVLSFTDIMHMLYHQRKLVDKQLGIEAFRKQLIKAVQLPMFMTSLTNIMGFLVFLLLSENRYLFNFSLVSIVGVSIAFLSSRFLFIYTLADYRAVIHKVTFSNWTRRYEQLIKRLAVKRKMIVGLFSVMSLIIIFLAVSAFRIDSSEGVYLSGQSALTRAGNILNEHFFGDKQAEVVIRSEGEIWSDENLKLIDSLEYQIRELFDPVYLESPALVVRRYRRFQRNGHPKAFSLPQKLTKTLKEDMNRFADNFGGIGILSQDQHTAKLSFGYRNDGLVESREQYQQMESLLQTLQKPGISLELTGRSYLGDRGTFNFTIKIIIGLIVGVLAASFLTMLFLRSMKKSLLLIFVNLFPVGAVLIIMLLTDIAITPLTLFFLSLLAGICVDDSIYIVAQSRSEKSSIHIFPIVVTSAVLTAGFIALGFSSFEWIQPFSWVFLVGIMLALIMDLLILPVFMSSDKR